MSTVYAQSIHRVLGITPNCGRPRPAIGELHTALLSRRYSADPPGHDDSALPAQGVKRSAVLRNQLARGGLSKKKRVEAAE